MNRLRRWSLPLALGVALATTGAAAQQQEAVPDNLRWELPAADEYAAHLQALCKPETESALFIATLRDRGSTKAQVQARLPEGNPDRLRVMRVVAENLDDLFAYGKIRASTYYIFRSQSCVREKAEGKPVLSFSAIAAAALECQESADGEAAQKLAECVRGLMP